jgi:protein-tyrosine phosphatase
MRPDVYWVDAVLPLRLAMMPRPRSGDWLEDEVIGWQREGIATVVCLLVAQEVRDLGLDAEAALCVRHGTAFLTLPVPDRSVPPSEHAFHALILRIVETLRDSRGVGVHCRAGIGRSGLVAACVLAQLGVPATRIFEELSRSRGVGVPDTPEQVAWFDRYCRCASRLS